MSYSTQKMLTDVQGKPIPQIYDPGSDRFVPLTTEIYRNVSDAAVKAELEQVKAELQELKSMTPRSYVGNSSDTKPEGKEGDSFIEGSRFVSRGGPWHYGSSAGVFALNASYPRLNSAHNRGFRSAYISPN